MFAATNGSETAHCDGAVREMLTIAHLPNHPINDAGKIQHTGNLAPGDLVRTDPDVSFTTQFSASGSGFGPILGVLHSNFLALEPRIQ